MHKNEFIWEMHFSNCCMHPLVFSKQHEKCKHLLHRSRYVVNLECNVSSLSLPIVVIPSTPVLIGGSDKNSEPHTLIKS